jgi:hypothetical protein
MIIFKYLWKGQEVQKQQQQQKKPKCIHNKLCFASGIHSETLEPSKHEAISSNASTTPSPKKSGPGPLKTSSKPFYIIKIVRLKPCKLNITIWMFLTRFLNLIYLHDVYKRHMEKSIRKRQNKKKTRWWSHLAKWNSR